MNSVGLSTATIQSSFLIVALQLTNLAGFLQDFHHPEYSFGFVPTPFYFFAVLSLQCLGSGCLFMFSTCFHGSEQQVSISVINSCLIRNENA